MSRKCSDLRAGEWVVFKLLSDIYREKIPETGTVVTISLDRRTVEVSYMEGYRERFELIPFADMIAVYNPDGEVLNFDNISGPSDLLIAE